MKLVAIAFALFAMLFAYSAQPVEAPPLSPGAIRPQEAASYMGRTVTVEGIAHVHIKNSASFIDMGGDYPFQAFQAVIFGDSADAFGDLNRFDGRTVNVTGRIREYNGKPEIILDDPGRLKAS